MSKKFKLKATEIKPLISKMGDCMATDKITVDGLKIGFFYREKARFENDSGWRFFSGKETKEYLNDPKNSSVFNVNTIANYDSTIIAFLDFPIGSEFHRRPGTDIYKLV